MEWPSGVVRLFVRILTSLSPSIRILWTAIHMVSGWLPREKDRDPKVCPKCKSPYWDRPRQSDVKPDTPKK